MIKKIIGLNLLLILVYSCGFSPIYSTKNQTFSIGNITLIGEKDINRVISKRLRNFTRNNASTEKSFDISITSNQEKNVTAKNKKGNPTQFSLRIEVDVILTDKLNQKKQITFTENSSYKNNDNKFDLKIYENNLIQNMSEKIFSDLILYIKNLD